VGGFLPACGFIHGDFADAKSLVFAVRPAGRTAKKAAPGWARLGEKSVS